MTGSALQQQACKNCGNTFTESFCNRCGQKEAHRITATHVMHDIMHVFLHADKGILAFIPQVVLQPGKIAKEYIEGKRRIFSPFQYLIFSVGFVLFLLLHAHFYETLQEYNTHNTSALPGYFQKGVTDFNEFVKKYANVITFLALPVYALFSWLFFKRKGQNYAEHFTIQVFVMSQTNTINILFLIGCIIFKAIGLGAIYFSVLLTIFCLALTYKQFYNIRWYISLWKGILVFACSYLMQMVLMGIGLVIYIIVLKSRH